jgi:hypothetical protein
MMEKYASKSNLNIIQKAVNKILRLKGTKDSQWVGGV